VREQVVVPVQRALVPASLLLEVERLAEAERVQALVSEPARPQQEEPLRQGRPRPGLAWRH
jgi:hypothetical protein